jgi:hypothetical protein
MGLVHTEIALKNAIDTGNARHGIISENKIRAVIVEALVDTGSGTPGIRKETMNLPAPRGGVSCRRCIISELRSVRKFIICGGLHSKPVYYHFFVDVAYSNRHKTASSCFA